MSKSRRPAPKNVGSRRGQESVKTTPAPTAAKSAAPAAPPLRTETAPGRPKPGWAKMTPKAERCPQPPLPSIFVPIELTGFTRGSDLYIRMKRDDILPEMSEEARVQFCRWYETGFPKGPNAR